VLDRVLDAVADAVPRVVVGPPRLVLPAGVLRVSEDPPGGGPVAALAAGLAAIEAHAQTGPQEAGGREASARGVRTDEAGAQGANARGANAQAASAQGARTVAVLAADLPFLTPQAIAALRRQCARESTVDGMGGVDGVVYVDENGRRQTLCGVWRTEALREALRRSQRHNNAALRDLLAGLRIREISHDAAGPPPWYDCDSPEDLDRAEGWA